MAMKAYILIVADPGRTKEVFAQLRQVPGVVEAHEVMGPYDIVVEVEVESLAEIAPILGTRIRKIEGIQSTTSLVALPD